YISTWFQLIIASCEVADGPALKLPDSGGEMKSNETSMEVTPAGTSTLMMKTSAGSRRHVSVLLPAVIFSPATSVTGPLGMCSPGIHLGYARRAVPGVTCIVSLA